ncbi:MAG: GIY-YIG nuclease family protein [Bacteroidales bacterium]|nr:GIY-YIG nuclease family protein [Bacteroidales bacterium]
MSGITASNRKTLRIFYKKQYISCKSLADGSFYIGYTNDLQKRLAQHNNGESRYTSKKMPWKTEGESRVFQRCLFQYSWCGE